ncbi:MAG: phosphate uptake regulator PhoU [Candidatus Heimdallarchaeota archaeon]|nr:phosphate uptake regulator PhoU [Candidatus Heimdallarchaeota archaeon]
MPKDITRSLQLTGARTYLVSLPREWIERNGLEAKDEIGIRIENETYLLLYPRNPRIQPRKSTTISENEKIELEILARYVTGFDTMIVVPTEGKKKILDPDKIREEIRHQIGLEIIREAPNQLEIQFIATSVLDLQTLLRKIYALSFSMLDDAISAIFTQDEEIKDRIIKRYSEVDRVYYFTVRLLQQSLEDPLEELNLYPFECLNYQIVVYQGEVLGRSCRELAERIGKFQASFLTPETESMVREISDKLIELLDDAIKAFLNKDISKALSTHEEVKNKKYQVQPMLAIISEESSDEPTWFLARLLSSLLEQADQVCYLTEIVARGYEALDEYNSKSYLDDLS